MRFVEAALLKPRPSLQIVEHPITLYTLKNMPIRAANLSKSLLQFLAKRTMVVMYLFISS